MFYELTIENSHGETMRLTHNPDYSVTEIKGMNPVNIDINTAENANADGSTFKSARMTKRNIVITLEIEGGDVERKRVALYNFFRAKRPVTVFYKTENREVFATGYTEKISVEYFDKKEEVQISIICPSSYLYGTTGIISEFATVTPLFEFPFSIDSDGEEFSRIDAEEEINVFNAGDVATGIIIEFHATGQVKNPVLYNVETSEHIRVIATMQDGDSIIIDTRQGSKSITKISGGIKTNILANRESGSSWLTLEKGDNPLIFGAEEGEVNLNCNITFDTLYMGI